MNSAVAEDQLRMCQQWAWLYPAFVFLHRHCECLPLDRWATVPSWNLVRGHVTLVVFFCSSEPCSCWLVVFLVARCTTFLKTRNVYGSPLQGWQRKGSLRETCPRKFDEYNETKDWHHYIESVNYFFEANEITDPGKRRFIFLVCGGAKTCKLVLSLVAAEDPKDRSYDDLPKLLQDHCMPKPSTIPQRFKFNTHSQSRAAK